MKFPRRRFLHLAAGAAALPVLSRSASAQAYWLGVGAPKDTPSDEPAGCRHQHRNRGRRECPLGWLHAPDGRALKCGQRDALRQTQIRISSRHRSRRKRNPSASSPAGGPVGRGQKRSRVDRLRQSQSRQDHDGIVRSRFESSRGSTRRSLPRWPIPTSRRASRLWEAPCLRSRRPNSASSLPTKQRSGARWFGRPTSGWNRHPAEAIDLLTAEAIAGFPWVS